MKSYIVPKNVRARFQFADGFGWFELLICLVGVITGGVIAAVVFLITKSPFSLTFLVFGGALGFFLGKPDPRTGQSALDLIKDYKAFNTKPKRYYYSFGKGRE